MLTANSTTNTPRTSISSSILTNIQQVTMDNNNNRTMATMIRLVTTANTTSKPRRQEAQDTTTIKATITARLVTPDIPLVKVN